MGERCFQKAEAKAPGQKKGRKGRSNLKETEYRRLRLPCQDLEGVKKCFTLQANLWQGLV